MFKKLICLGIMLSMLTGLTGCTNAGPNETGGRLMGGVAGALLGSQIGKGSGRLWGVGIGALAGSFIGGALGARLDARDKQLARHTMEETLESAPDYQERSWNNPNTHHRGTFRVTRTVEVPRNHQVCRDYVHTVIIDGRQEKVHGRACRDVRDPRAQWFVQD